MKALLLLVGVVFALTTRSFSSHQPIRVQFQVPRGHSEIGYKDRISHDHSSLKERMSGFDRSGVEAQQRPQVSFRKTFLEEIEEIGNNRVPLRDAVEKIPIEGTMAILRYSSPEVEALPFSRAHVEAFPSIDAPLPEVVPYSAPSEDNFFIDTRDNAIEPYALSGFRGDIESGHRSPNLNPFASFRKSGSTQQAFSIWRANEQQPSPSTYQNQINAPRGKIFCYLGSWAIYRDSPMNYDADNVQATHCSHVIYSHANMDERTFEVTPLNYEQDVVKGYFRSTTGLKRRNSNLQVLLRVGAWDEGGYRYSKMASTPENRKKFVASVLRTLRGFGFDGIDFNWNFPASTDYGGSPSDKENLVMLTEELKQAFPKGKTLALSIPIDKTRLDLGYDFPSLSKSVDFFILKSYDLRGAWDGRADHHAPLFTRSTDTDMYNNLNVRKGVKHIEASLPDLSKLILGIPFYGRTFTLRHKSSTHPGSESMTVGRELPYTKAKGLAAYYEICALQRNPGWKFERDEIGAPYAFKNDMWIGYDDEENVKMKTQYAMSEGLGGVSLYSLDLDDFVGLCGKRNPLLRAATRAMEASRYSHNLVPSSYSFSQIATIREPGPEAPVVTHIDPTSSGLAEGAPCSSDRTRDPSDCAAYFECVNGKFRRQTCPSGLYYDQTIGNCNWPYAVNCDASSLPVSPAVSPQTPDSSTTTPKPVVLASAPQPTGSLSGDYVVVCYFTNWAWYRPGIGKYKPNDIDARLCTHVLYGFAVLDYSNLITKTHDSWADIDNKFYTQVTSIKKGSNRKVLLALGGWNDSRGNKYSRLVHSPAARKKFIDHVIPFLKKYDFDGLDLDWEYPVCWQVECKKGPKSDKEMFTAWVRELREAFTPHGLMLTAAVSPNYKVVDLGYDVPAVSRYLDWIAVMTYDYYGAWDKRTGHHAPMYAHPELNQTNFNADASIKHWMKRGAPANKLVFGMPMYGRAFTLDDRSISGLNVSARGKGTPGKYTREGGFLAYYEICHDLQRGGAKVVYDPLKRMGPYYVSGNQWVGYDDVDTIRQKSEYIRKVGLLGGMIWALDLDDFRNRCGQGAHPLLSTINSVLNSPRGSIASDGTGFPPIPGESTGTQPSQVYPVSPVQPEETLIPVPGPGPVSKPRPDPDTETGVGPTVEPDKPIRPPPGGTTAPISTKDGFKVVCYYTNWSWYRQGAGKYLPSDIDPNLCTHIMYGFAVLDSNNYKIKPHDTWADIDNKFYEKLVEFKKYGIKVLLAIGGWNDSLGPKYSNMVNSPSLRSAFNTHVLGFIQKYNFDGLDLDWEYPKCWQVDCNKGPASDKQAFSMWIKELHDLFAPHGLLLTAAVSPNPKVIDQGYEVPMLSRYLDIINVMTYDYHGQWDKHTGHHSPLYDYPESPNHQFNADYTINYYISKGADPKKLIMGMPTYGQSFTRSWSEKGEPDLNQKTQGGGEAGEFTRARGFLAYYEICHNIIEKNWIVERKYNKAMGPFSYKGNQWVSFDDVPKIREKSEYAKAMGLGGAMIWALDLDDFRNRCNCENYPLLKTINRVLRPEAVPSQDPGCNHLGSGAPPPTPPVTRPMTSPTQKPHTRPTPPPIVTPIPTPKPQTVPPIFTPGPSPPPPPVAGAGVEGAACKDGEFRRHPTDCSKFFECFKGKQREILCAYGLFWDGRRMCTKKEFANCHANRPIGVGTIHITSKPPPVTTSMATTWTTTTTTTTTTEKPSWEPDQFPPREPGVEQGTPCNSQPRFIRHPTKCDQFYECLHGKRNLILCSSGLYFNTQTEYCDWKQNVQCTSSSLPVDTTPKPTPWTHPPKHTPWTHPTKQTPWTPPPKVTVAPVQTTSPDTGYVPPGQETGYKVVCYFTNWAWYRPGVGKFLPSHVDPQLCTHVMFGFAVLNPNTLLIKPHDTWADIDNSFYTKLTDLKKVNPNIKVLIAIGGWNDSLGNKYSKLVHSQAARAKFIAHVIEFIAKYNFDGLDLDWEYPVCWQVDCKKGPKTDREMFTAWVRELYTAFKPLNLLLTAAVSPSYKVIDLAYDVPSLNQYFDFINVMTYDYFGHWDKSTFHQSPLRDHPESLVPQFNAEYTMNYFVAKGADRKKLIMGIPMYGQAFTLDNAANNGLNSPARQKGQAGQFTRAAGFLAYYEICKKVKYDQYTLVRDPNDDIGPYAYKGNQWVGFDDSYQVEKKSQLIVQKGYGGAMIWALDLDDFNNYCECEPYPLLRTINRVLRNYPKSSTNCMLR